MQKKISTLIGTVIIIAVAIIAFAGIFAWQKYVVKNAEVKNEVLQNNETADPALSEVEGWKTYTNTEYGFEIKYPSGIGEVLPGTVFGGGIQEQGEKHFAIPYQLDHSFPSGSGFVVFSIKPTQFRNNDELLVSLQNNINKNPNIKNIWKVKQNDFLNMGNAVIRYEVAAAPNSILIGCKPTGTLSESVFIVKYPYLFTFNDYRCDDFKGLPVEVASTFKFTK